MFDVLTDLKRFFFTFDVRRHDLRPPYPHPSAYEDTPTLFFYFSKMAYQDFHLWRGVHGWNGVNPGRLNITPYTRKRKREWKRERQTDRQTEREMDV